MRILGIVFIAVAGLALGLLAWFQADIRAAHHRLATGATTLSMPGGDIEYATAGSGPDVLVIHGSAGGFDQGLAMVGPMADRGYRLVVPSRAGYLRSAMPDGFTVAAQADAYATLLDHLDVARAAVIAISAGAWSALAFAERHPERCAAVVLVVPAAPLPPGQDIHGGWIADRILHSDFVAWLAVRLAWAFPGALSESLLGTDGDVLAAASASERARVAGIQRLLLPISMRRRGIEFDIETAANPPQVDWSRIDCPVLTISTEDDAFHTADRAAEIVDRIDGADLTVFPTGGHALVGRLDEVLDAGDTFLRSNSTGRGPRE
ncbi:MAG: alpha/beta hydrolase [Maritimibacter sp.]|nr:alpha/beta hydrolase [Maritimibacter sp.]